MFDSKKFEELLRSAAITLDDACDMLETADPESIAAPGAGYLLARMHLALELVELELPEFKHAAQLTLASTVGDTVIADINESWRARTFGQGAPKL